MLKRQLPKRSLVRAYDAAAVVVELHDYVIEKRGNQWCVLTSDKSKVLGCHSTLGQAQAQLGAIEASKKKAGAGPTGDMAPERHSDGLHAIRNVEVFKAGTWKGDKYTLRDLDDMVAAAPKVGFRPPVTLDHKDEGPAYGWIQNLRRVGSKLIADFVDITASVYDAIRQRRVGPVSAEIAWNFDRGGVTYPRVLRAVSLLGAKIPAVAGLKPAFENLSDDVSFELRTYEVQLIPLPKEQVKFTLQEMESLCSPCAEHMRSLGFKEITFDIERDEYGKYQINLPPKTIEGLCARFGSGNGQWAECASTMEGRVDDPEGFCGALKATCAEGVTMAQNRRHQEVELTRERLQLKFTIAELQKVCPSCASTAQASKLAEITYEISKGPEGEYGVSELPAAFLSGLAANLGPADSFCEECWVAFKDRVTDEEDFCSQVYQYLLGKGLLQPVAKASLSDGRDGAVDDKERKTYEDTVTKLEKQIQDLQRSKDVSRLQTMENDLTTAKAELAALHAERRTDKVSGFVEQAKKAGKVTPAQVPMLLALFGGLEEEREIILSVDGKEERIGVGTLLRRYIESMPTTVFYGEVGGKGSDREPTGDTVGALVHARVLEYAEQHKLDPIKDYSKALKLVLDADPALKAEYAHPGRV